MKKIGIVFLIAIILCVSVATPLASADQTDLSKIITPELLTKIEETPEDELISVSIWTEEIDFDAVQESVFEKIGFNKEILLDMKDEDVSLEKVNAYIAEERTIYSERQLDCNSEILYSFFDEDSLADRSVYISKYAPLIYVDLTPQEILSFASGSGRISSIDEVVPLEAVNFSEPYDVSEPLNLRDLPLHDTEMNDYFAAMGITTLRDVYGYTGEGIKIGQLEIGVPNTTLACFSGATITTDVEFGALGHYDNPDSIVHASSIACMLISRDPNAPGIVPDAELYLAAFWTQIDMVGAAEWLLDQGVNVINMSAGFTYSNYSLYANLVTWTEHIALRHEVHFVVAAGNVLTENYDEQAVPYVSLDYNVSVPALAYNCIAVGNCTRSSRYEYSRYLQPSGCSDKPDISAFGCLYLFPNYLADANRKCGTSFSAPCVAGVVAQLLQAYPSLKIKQDVMKAILLASANGMLQFDTVTTTSEYDECGAGLLDATAALYIANHGRTAYSSFAAGASNGTTYTCYFDVSQSDTEVRVALTWLKYVILNPNYNPPDNSSSCDYNLSNVQSTAAADLDLKITGPTGTNIIYNSTNIPGNVELIDFEPPVSGRYKITVTFYGPTTKKTYFGLAWW